MRELRVEEVVGGRLQWRLGLSLEVVVVVVLGEDEWREGHRVSLLGLGRQVGHRWVIVGSSLGWSMVLRHPTAVWVPRACGVIVGSSLGHLWVIVGMA